MPDTGKIFVTGATGPIGRQLMPCLVRSGYQVTCVVREGFELEVPLGCYAVAGDVLDGRSYAGYVSAADTVVQLAEEVNPVSANERQFSETIRMSSLESIQVAREKGVKHFIYVGAEHLAGMKRTNAAVQSACQEANRLTGLTTTILRSWYILGTGRCWPGVDDGFARLEDHEHAGLVTVRQAVLSLEYAIANPARGVETLEISRFGAIMARAASA
jgi:nucleoside-diphosphate-sugar epimerase